MLLCYTGQTVTSHYTMKKEYSSPMMHLDNIFVKVKDMMLTLTQDIWNYMQKDSMLTLYNYPLNGTQ